MQANLASSSPQNPSILRVRPPGYWEESNHKRVSGMLACLASRSLWARINLAPQCRDRRNHDHEGRRRQPGRESVYSGIPEMVPRSPHGGGRETRLNSPYYPYSRKPLGDEPVIGTLSIACLVKRSASFESPRKDEHRREEHNEYRSIHRRSRRCNCIGTRCLRSSSVKIGKI